jgi:hypothetical protein
MSQAGDNPTEDGWLIPHKKMRREVWVVDPEGRHRFWVPVDWRGSWDREHWHHDISTLFSDIGDFSQPVVIRF